MSTESLRNELLAWIGKLDDQGLLKALHSLKRLLASGGRVELTEEEREAMLSRIAGGGSGEDRAFWQQLAGAGLSRAFGDDEPDISGITLLEPNPERRPFRPAERE